jgi:hypothetical protein
LASRTPPGDGNADRSDVATEIRRLRPSVSYTFTAAIGVRPLRCADSDPQRVGYVRRGLERPRLVMREWIALFLSCPCVLHRRRKGGAESKMVEAQALRGTRWEFSFEVAAASGSYLQTGQVEFDDRVDEFLWRPSPLPEIWSWSIPAHVEFSGISPHPVAPASGGLDSWTVGWPAPWELRFELRGTDATYGCAYRVIDGWDVDGVCLPLKGRKI